MAAADKRAVVIGASMAGLLAARVLADRFSEVTLVERDDLSNGAAARKGVPQGRHAHALLISGRQILADLFPSLTDDLLDGGALVLEVERSWMWQNGGYRIIPPGVMQPISMSRPFLEETVRRLVLALPQVKVWPGRAAGLAVAEGRVVGLNVSADDGTTVLPCDLVVDASGRASQAGRWLEEHGFPSPELTEIRIDVAYASRFYSRDDSRHDGYVTIADSTVPGRIGAAFPVEGGRYLVTAGGCHGDHPPSDEAGFAAFVEGIPPGDVACVMRNSEPLTPLVTHRFPSSQRRHFEKVRRHLPGFVAIGDAVCSFNPIYGQGMSSAAMQAVALAATLDRHGIEGPDLARSFYAEAAKVVANPWSIAAGGDFVLPQTTGPKPPLTGVLNRYVSKATIASQHDLAVATTLWNVGNLLTSPSALLTPAMVARVLRTARRGPTGPRVPGDEPASVELAGS